MKYCILSTAVAMMGMCSLATAEEHEHALLSSNQLIGDYIYNAGDESLATVKSVILNQKGQPQFIVANVGGLAGIGATHVAIPWKAVNTTCKVEDGQRECRLSVSMTKERLAKAPQIKTAEFNELSDTEWLNANAEYYSAKAPQMAEKPEEMICVASVTDATVHGSNNESVGHLDAIIMDMKTGEAQFGIVGDGGTLGVNEKYTAVPFNALKFRHNREQVDVSINATPSEVKAAPSVTPSGYPELELASVRDRINDSFHATK